MIIYTAILVLYIITLICFYIDRNMLKERVDALEHEQFKTYDKLSVIDEEKHDPNSFFIYTGLPIPTIDLKQAFFREQNRLKTLEQHLGVEYKLNRKQTVPAHYEKVKKEGK